MRACLIHCPAQGLVGIRERVLSPVMGAGSGRRHHRLVGTELRLRAAGGGLADARAAGEGQEASFAPPPSSVGQ